MGDEFDDQALIRRYLLCDLDEEETKRVELRVMADPDYGRLVDILESELVDEYAEGSLSTVERERFERVFLPVPQRRDQVTFALALRKYAAEHSLGPGELHPGVDTAVETDSLPQSTPGPESPIRALPGSSPHAQSLRGRLAARGNIFRMAVAASVFLFLGSAWLAYRALRTPSDYERYSVNRSAGSPSAVVEPRPADDPAPEEKTAESPKIVSSSAGKEPILAGNSSAQRSSPETNEGHADQEHASNLALVLMPRRLRGEGDSGSVLTFSRGGQPQPLRLTLPTGSLYSRYAATLQANGGESVEVPGPFSGKTSQNVRAARGVVVQLPSGLLKNGDYRLFLYGVSADNSGEKSVGGQATGKTAGEGGEEGRTLVAVYNFRVIIK